MRRLNARLAATCACVVATAVLTGTALADPGNGNSANAPGQVKQEPTQSQPAAQPQPQQPTAQQQPAAQQPQPTAPGQAKKQAPATQQSSSPGQAKKQAAATQQSSSPGQTKQAAKASSSSPGVKPGSGTTKWTHCITGTSSSGATCTSSDNGHTPQTKADVSKQYGNGKTAAQIAVSRGGVNVQLTGPGNSQPHKVTVCGKPSNKSGGVDVHAVKSYDASACAPQTVTPQVTQSSSSVCGATTVTTASTQVVGVLHGKHQHLMTNPKSAHFTKHDDQKVTVTSTQTSVVPNGESCSSRSSTPSTPTQSSTPTQPSTPTQAPQSGSISSQSPATPVQTPQLTAPIAAPAAGGVLGAQTSLAKPAAAPHHGVLGTVTHVAGGTLPFTGFPVWVAVLIAVALILAGIALRRRTLGARL